MRKWLISGVLVLGFGVVAGFAWGRIAPSQALRRTGISDIQEAAFFFNQASHEPAQFPRTVWISEGVGYLGASVAPLEHLGMTNMNRVASAVSTAAYGSLRAHDPSFERRLFASFQQKMMGFHSYSYGTIPEEKLEQAMNSLVPVMLPSP